MIRAERRFTRDVIPYSHGHPDLSPDIGRSRSKARSVGTLLQRSGMNNSLADRTQPKVRDVAHHPIEKQRSREISASGSIIRQRLVAFSPIDNRALTDLAAWQRLVPREGGSVRSERGTGSKRRVGVTFPLPAVACARVPQCVNINPESSWSYLVCHNFVPLHLAQTRFVVSN
jgi:hypothetical protein